MISPYDIMIDPNRIESIKNIVLLHTKRAMWFFWGKLNFMGRFISDFAETIKPLQEMIRKDEN